MKTSTPSPSVNYTSGKFLRILELKKQIGKTISVDEFLYKNTLVQVRKEMKGTFGKVLNEIPRAFILNGMIWKASINKYQHKGRTFESFRFLPLYSI